jgi:hypothetical protein
VLIAARASVVQARCEAGSAAQGAADEGVRWVSASRSQPTEAAAKLLRGLTDTEGELACLHTDVLAALFRVELGVGKAEQHAAAAGKQVGYHRARARTFCWCNRAKIRPLYCKCAMKPTTLWLLQRCPWFGAIDTVPACHSPTQARLAESVTRREKQSNIFGVRTMKDRRLDEGRIAAAGQTPPNPAAKERELLAACGKNGYEKAVALMQMARFQGEPHRAAAMLTEAAELLVRAQEREDAAAAAAAPPDRAVRTSNPAQPRILQRTPTSVTITNFPFALKGGKRPARFSVYGKSYGAGVALILNKTATEYPGA